MKALWKATECESIIIMCCIKSIYSLQSLVSVICQIQINK